MTILTIWTWLELETYVQIQPQIQIRYKYKYRFWAGNLQSAFNAFAWSRVGGTTPYLILFWIPDWDSQRKISSFFCLHLPYQQIGEKSLPIFFRGDRGDFENSIHLLVMLKETEEWLLSAVKCTGFTHPDLSLAQSKMSNCWSYNPKNILKNPSKLCESIEARKEVGRWRGWHKWQQCSGPTHPDLRLNPTWHVLPSNWRKIKKLKNWDASKVTAWEWTCPLVSINIINSYN